METIRETGNTETIKIVITHGYSDSNKGDLAIVMGTILGIRKVAPNASIVLHSVFSESDPNFRFHSRFIALAGVRVIEGVLPSPYVDDKKSGLSRNLVALVRLAKNALCLNMLRILPSIFSSFCSRKAYALQTMKDADVVIAKGGQYIYNDQGGVRGSLYLWRMLKIISIANQSGNPTVLLGHSIGPLLGSRTHAAVKEVLHGCRAIIVREKFSLKLLSDIGIHENVSLAPDMAFLIEPVKPESMEVSLDEGVWIGVVVVNWMFPGALNLAKKREEYIQALLDTLTEAYRKWGLKPIIFPQVTVRHHGESDMDLIEKLYKKLISRGVPAKYMAMDLSPAELSFLYGKCAMLLGTRLHSCILAACAGCPVIAIRYQGYKTEGVMEGMGLVEYVHDINSLMPDELNNSINKVMKNREKLSKQISGYVTGYREQLIKTVQHVLDLSACSR